MWIYLVYFLATFYPLFHLFFFPPFFLHVQRPILLSIFLFSPSHFFFTLVIQASICIASGVLCLCLYLVC